MDNLTFGQRIVSFRTKKQMLQRELAEAMDILPTTLSRYENDVREPDVATLFKLIIALDVTGDELLGITRDNAPTFAQSDDEIQLLNNYRAVNKAGKEFIRQSVGMVINQPEYKKSTNISDMEASNKYA